MDVSPPDAQRALDRAIQLHGAREDGEALVAIDAALAAKPSWPQAHNVRGAILHSLGRLDAALAAFAEAARLAPDDSAAQRGQGSTLWRLGRQAEALEHFDAALALRPDDSAALVDRAGLLRDLGQREAALADMEAALRLKPNAVGLTRNWVYLLIEHRGVEAAVARVDAELALRPQSAALHNALAIALQAAGRPQAAVESFDRALALGPPTAQTEFGRSLSLLALGRFEEGWRAYERRWEDRAFLPRGSGAVTAPLARQLLRWPTREALAGRDILLVSEQGVGDVIMFASLAPEVLAIAARVSIRCEARLRELFLASFPSIQAAGPDVTPSDDAVVVALGSLPFAFRRQRADFPGHAYLHPSEAACAIAAQRLGPHNAARRIGLSWRGGGKVTGADRRSLPLAALRPILELADCEFVSLQYGDHADEIEAVNRTLTRPIRLLPPDDIADFDHLAATVLEMDHVVSVQTALVHLSGALGVPCTVMVPSAPEWRYGVGGETMPWYRSVRLVRQARAGEWDEVVDRVARQLASN